ncbi:MAG: LD-carboxypeptidase [Bacteroidetes bacterium]|nr:LD-carboxypeptidase [Bacteroidota bacterium]
MIRPPYLKAGDTVAIVSTARKVSKFEIKPAIDLLKSWGLEVQTGKNLFKEDHQFAGTDEDRAGDLQRALNNKNVQAVLFARGGYGTTRIIDAIDWKKFIKQPKWLIGYSDITVVHSHVHRHCGIQTLHGPMSLNLGKLSPQCLSVLKETLFGQTLRYSSSKQQPHLEKLNRKGKAKGRLVGGNLSILYSQAATPSDIDTAGKILFLEDLDEYLYHIDRMMMNLKRSGKLKDLAGLIVGGMTEMKDNTIPFGKTAEEIIHDAVKEYTYPVVYGFPAGHIPNNYPMIFGSEVTLNVTEKMELTFHND